MKQVDILKYVNLMAKVIYKLRQNLIQKVQLYFDENPIILGGPGVLVQIDETMLNHKVKAHRGRSPKEQTWALGMVDCIYKPAKNIMMLIHNKSGETILPLIKKHIRKGSLIHTDEAKVYAKLGKDPEYIHKSIIHKYKFVDYIDEVHTQNIESYNNKIKPRIKEMKGIIGESRERILAEFLWLDNNFNGCFELTLNLIKFN